MNPNHLELGTDADNIYDWMQRGKSDCLSNKGETGIVCPECNIFIRLQTQEERFWSKVDKNGPTPSNDKKCKDVCWTWYGGKDSAGYGSVMIKSTGDRAHRISWEYANNQKIPNDLLIRHQCDNKSCVNPQHLVLGTHADNNRDTRERNESYAMVGEDNPCSKLTEDKVRLIKIEYMDGASLSQLGKKYDVTSVTILNIIDGSSWNYVATDIECNIRKNHKLTEEQVKHIRIERAEGMTNKELSKKYNVSVSTIKVIVSRRSWKHVA